MWKSRRNPLSVSKTAADEAKMGTDRDKPARQEVS